MPGSPVMYPFVFGRHCCLPSKGSGLVDLSRTLVSVYRMLVLFPGDGNIIKDARIIL
jgi:hypothetical protein